MMWRGLACNIFLCRPPSHCDIFHLPGLFLSSTGQCSFVSPVIPRVCRVELPRTEVHPAFWFTAVRMQFVDFSNCSIGTFISFFSARHNPWECGIAQEAKCVQPVLAIAFAEGKGFWVRRGKIGINNVFAQMQVQCRFKCLQTMRDV